ncbi:MAG: carbohydrate-binding protein, partial [Eubacteriales bacterium]|nr:carbohydrate-binding protein [Eubacteriales bacterium]
TDTEGGLRHYICADCGDEYSYETDPMVYTENPKTGEPVDTSVAVHTENGTLANPILPEWEHIPDGEPQVFWSKEDKEWRVYIYGSHDVDGTTYCGPNYELWSAPVYDLSDWRDEGTILDITETNLFEAMNLFAPDCAYDLQSDTYYLVSNEFNSTSVLRSAANPAGPFDETSALWAITVKACYDPSIYIENGTIYIAGSCMKQYWNEVPGISEIVNADGYASGMSHIGVIYQLKDSIAKGEGDTEGDGVEAVTWLPTDEKDYLPIFEGPSLVGYVEEAGAYLYLCVEQDRGSDGTEYNSTIGYLWTDNIMNGTWHYGNNGVEETYGESEGVISGNHGNVISDTSGRYVKNAESGEMEFVDFPTYVYANNHGSIAKVNGNWYFFGHRHTNAHTYSRQAIAGKITVGTENDAPLVTPMEFTSSGIADSMNAFENWDASVTTYILEAADHQAPALEKNPHKDCVENTAYVFSEREKEVDPVSYVTNIKEGTVIGYKYLNFGEEESSVTANLVVSKGEGSVDLYLDAPTEENGGTKLGTVTLSGDQDWNEVSEVMEQTLSGIHGVYYVFHGSDLQFRSFGFTK